MTTSPTTTVTARADQSAKAAPVLRRRRSSGPTPKHPVMKRIVTDYHDQIAMFPRGAYRRWAVFVVVLAVALPWVLSRDITPPMNLPWNTWFTVVNLSLLSALGAAAFNLLVGYTGQLSLAHAGFLTVGAMSTGYFGVQRGLPLPLVLVIGALAGAVVGALVGLPALRLKGPYLLLATLGVYFVSSLAWKEFLVANFGFVGMQVERPQLPAWTADLPLIGTDTGEGMLIRTNLAWYILLLPVCGLVMLFLSNLTRSREGRAFAAVRERDVSASLLGINVARTKLLAFAVSSAVVTLSGALSSYFLGARGEDSFPIQVTLNFAIMIVVGGFSSIQGAIFGAMFFHAMPEIADWTRSEVPVLRDIKYLQDHAGEIDLLIFGLLVVLVLMTKPAGLTGLWRDIKGWFSRWPFTI
jgi:branched-chain amino acid transport system permease protein